MWVRVLPLALVLACDGKALDSDVLTRYDFPTTPTAATGSGGSGTGSGDAGGDGSATGTGSTDDGVGLQVEIVENDFMVPVGEPLRVRALVNGTFGHAVDLEWSSSIDGHLRDDVLSGDGEARLTVSTLSAGWHDIVLTARGDGDSASDSAHIPVCDYPPREDFDLGLPAGWTLYYDAAWDPGGWLEITGNEQDRRGAIFRTSHWVNPGDVAIEFDIATGGGLNSGADGYAVSVIKAADLDELGDLIAASEKGGCLGYGFAPPCGTSSGTAFHIEFDTWYNAEYHDPTEQNHLAITLNGDPSTHYFHAAIPSLEDLRWRHVRVEVVDETITVYLDTHPVIAGAIPGFEFEGGFIGVSGSTGWASNYHRFDNLKLYDACVVP